MSATSFTAAFLAALFAFSLAAQAPGPSLQQPPAAPASKSIKLDVVVENKMGLSLTALHQQDFTIFDNKSQSPITSFRVETPKDEPVEVIVYLDAVNSPYELLAQIRNGVDKFFKANEGTLAHPTTFAFLTDDGSQFNKRFSSSGIMLSNDLEQDPIGLREIVRSSQWGAVDRLNLGVKAIRQLVDFSAKLPGRKMVIFVSPGFPLLSGPNIEIDAKEQRQIFSETVYLTNQMRQNRITFYEINPIGVSQSMFRANYYQNFLKGVARPNDAQLADLSPQVLSPQSGGLTLISNNDIPGMIQRCLLDSASWYRISFDPSPSGKPNEYHHIQVRVDMPAALVRTRDGYYANPAPVAGR